MPEFLLVAKYGMFLNKISIYVGVPRLFYNALQITGAITAIVAPVINS